MVGKGKLAVLNDLCIFNFRVKNLVSFTDTISKHSCRYNFEVRIIFTSFCNCRQVCSWLYYTRINNVYTSMSPLFLTFTHFSLPPSLFPQGGTVLSGYALTYTDELISCNLESGLWQTEPVVPSETPLPLKRDFHSAVYVNERIVVFGGKCELTPIRRT